MLQTQSSRKRNLWQTCHEIAEKSSKIVPSGAPLFPVNIVKPWQVGLAERAAYLPPRLTSCRGWQLSRGSYDMVLLCSP
jgi:hypothetical protein